MELMRWCPGCESERALDEHFCAGLAGGAACGWVLSGEPIHPRGWRPAAVVTGDDLGGLAEPAPESAAQAPRCRNGHAMESDDLICMCCGAEPAEVEAADTASAGPASTQAETIIEHWRLLTRIGETAGRHERYRARHESTGHEAVLTLYHPGAEPDPDVYETLARLPCAHVPELIATGRWDDRPFEVMEELGGGTLADLGIHAHDDQALRHIVRELGPVLHAFAEAGLRHRDLRPQTILVRAREPLDLVIGGFGSARLSAFDLDLVPPLETSRYMAPEAVAGGVAAASDWWSLGMLLLEQITAGTCFEGIHPNAWLIHVIANGVPLPKDLPPDLSLLLRGLLAYDHHQRWQWREVEAWLAGQSPPAPPAARHADEHSGEGIELGGQRWHDVRRFALAAGEAAHWPQALEHLRRGALLHWAESAGLESQRMAALRHVARHETLQDDFRLMLALAALNPDMPLILRGEIVSPGWLLDHRQEAWDLLISEAPDLLAHRQAEHWLPRMKARVEHLRARAQHRGIALDEAQFRILALASSRARLAAQWQARQQLLPDSPNPGIQALSERAQLSEEDLIVLLAAEIGQFQSADTVLDASEQRARRAGIGEFQREQAAEWLRQGRRAIWQAIDARTQGFASCGIEALDRAAGQYRVQRHLPLADALVLLALPAERWVEPKTQQYLAQLLGFFEKKVIAGALRGPLVRMSVARNSARIDLTELGSTRRPALDLLETLLQRGGQPQAIDPAVFAANPALQHRLNTLERNRSLYERDTGIDGLYLGFPFLLWRDPRGHIRTRIVPLLLWPVSLELPVGRRAQARLGFDSAREEVRLNPALEGILGSEERERWQKAADELLQRSAITATDVMDVFGMLAPRLESTGALRNLPPLETELPPGQQALVQAAVLFHATFIGQAIGQELRVLQQRSPGGTSLETLLRLREHGPHENHVRPPESQRFLLASSDPSQEAAVLQAALAPGLVIEGPPGTGKSQTIVNMVADAIGHGRSLLLVCQKPAALEVVHKRLVAEGLGQRVMMLTDVNRDREPAIRAIREQVEALLRDPPLPDETHQREQNAARIQALEGELDRHHEALHRVDATCGMSWRQLLGELIDLETGASPLDFPALRIHVGGLDAAALTALEENCAPLIRWWLPARYEGSALADLLPFSADAATCTAFTHAFEEFANAETARDEVLGQYPASFDIGDPEPHRSWLAEHAQALRALQPEQRQRLAQWLPLFRGNGAGSALIEQLQQALQQMRGIDDSPWQEQISTALTELSAAQLADLQQHAEAMRAPASFLARCNPRRWFGQVRVRRFLRQHGQSVAPTTVDALLDTCRLETQWRTPRIALAQIHRGLSLSPAAAQSAPSVQTTQAAQTARHLLETREAANRLARAPEPARADAAAGRADPAALDAWLNEVEAALLRHAARQRSGDCLGALSGWLQAQFQAQLQSAIDQNAGTAVLRGPLHDALPTLAAYQQFRNRAARLSEADFALLARLRPLQTVLEALPAEQLESVFRRMLNREARLAWKQAIEQQHPELLLEADEYASRVRQLAEADAKMRQLNRRQLASRIDSGRIGSRKAWEDITRLRGARTRRLREFLSEGMKIGLMQLKPAWLMNPDVASRVLPLQPGLFDVVIYDEASQMPVEYALPSLYRGKTAVVSGDEKQMPPTAFFASKTGDDEEQEDEDSDAMDEQTRQQNEQLQWNRREIKDCPDLLQLARGSLPGATLQIHYRSRYRELIGYSNAAFYRNRLHVPVRHPPATVLAQQPLEWRQVNGVYRQQTNAEEARAVVEWLAEAWQLPATQRPSVGVVTFNRKQADLIDKVMEERAEADEAFRQAWTEERERKQDGEDMGVFVKNVENVQGDERDVIVFSTTFGRDAAGVFRRNFGVLGQTGGERRLNVAVTRSRQKVLVMSSMPVADVGDFLTTRRAPGAPRDYLQGWLAYARMLSHGDFDAATALLARLHRDDVAVLTVAQAAPEDGFRRSVADFVRELGHTPRAAGSDDAFALDFAIEDPVTGLYAIGIECDSPHHPLLAHARAREIWRPRLLSQTIGCVHRVSVAQWYRDRVHAQASLRAAIDAAFAEEA